MKNKLTGGQFTKVELDGIADKNKQVKTAEIIARDLAIDYQFFSKRHQQSIVQAIERYHAQFIPAPTEIGEETVKNNIIRRLANAYRNSSNVDHFLELVTEISKDAVTILSNESN